MISAEQRLEQWARTVDDVEHGYALTYEDYLNDLDVRRTFNDAPLAHAVREQLAGLDARFRAATFPSGECVWGVDNEEAEGWDRVTHWYENRLPPC
jgi:hypothetical protein